MTALTEPVHDGDHVGSPFGDELDAGLPSERPHLGLDELGRRCFAQAAVGVVHAGDAHQFASEVHERVDVDVRVDVTVAHRF